MMFKGSMVALITPFDEKGDLDEKALKNLINWHLEAKTDGLVLSGTTGESPTLSNKEKLRIFEIAVSLAKGKTKIIAGTGTYSTQTSKELTKEAKKIGVDGCLVVVPYYNKPTEIGLFKHYQEIANENLPIILYHHPGRTGTKLSLEFFKKLESIKQIVAIKEASGNLEFFKNLKNICNIPLLSGDDPLTIDMMKMGAVGSISVVANIIPKEWKQIHDHCLSGDFDRASAIYKDREDLIDAMFLETNPQCVKYGLSLLKKCKASFRLPLVEPKSSNKLKIQKFFKD